jgi:hypothetical protein
MLTVLHKVFKKRISTMWKWIAICVVLVVCGCAGHRTRITIKMVHGEPSVSIEFEDKGT